MKYIVTEDIESPAKVAKGIEIFDFFFLLIYIGISFVLMNMVHGTLKAPFMIFSLLVAIFLTSKSRFNKKRRNFESIILFIQRDKEVYQPFIEEGKEEIK
jgi:uncharacterized membrane-anchored protein YitT (DUF2179 family)